MSNHVHLILRGTTEQLSACMFWTNHAYSRYHNRRYDLSGHTFEGPYFAKPVANSFYLKRALRYVHLNPVRAGLAQRPEDYPWSNCHNYFFGKPDRLRSQIRQTLTVFDGSPTEAPKLYREFVGEGLAKPRRVKSAKHPAAELWTEQFHWIRELIVERAAKVEPLDSDALAIYLGVRSGIPPRYIARAIGDQTGKTISSTACRFGQKLERNPVLLSKVASLGIA